MLRIGRQPSHSLTSAVAEPYNSKACRKTLCCLSPISAFISASA
jgi:hypothetical protein